MSMYESGEYLAKNADWHAEDSPWKAAKIDQILRRFGQTPRSIAEIGTGAGKVLITLGRLRPGVESLTGFDISADALVLAKDNLGLDDSVTFRMGSPDLGENFDLVLLVDVLEHVEDYWQMIRNAGSYGAVLCAHIPLEMNVLQVARPKTLSNARSKVGHIHHFNVDTALGAFTDQGFKIIGFDYTFGAIDLASGGLKRRLVRPIRRLLSAISPKLSANFLGGASVLILAASPSVHSASTT